MPLVLWPTRTLYPDQVTPLPNVHLTAVSTNGNWEGDSDACGWFHPKLAPGKYLVAFDAPGYHADREWTVGSPPLDPILVALDKVGPVINPNPALRTALVFPTCGSCPTPDSFDKTLPWTLPQDRDVLRANFWLIPVYVNGIPLPFVPGITSSKHPERFLSYLFPIYPTEYQEQWFVECFNRDYRTGMLSWPNSRVQGGQSIAQFKVDCQRFKAALPYLHVKLGSKDFDPRDQTLEQWKATLDPLMDALAGLVDEYSFWEYDLFNKDGQQALDIHHYIGQRAHAQGASFWCHFTCDASHSVGFWGGGSETGWYQQLGDACDGLDLQTYQGWDIGLTQAHIVDHLRDVGNAGKKVRLFEPGTPMAGFDGDITEDQSDAWGFLVCCTRGISKVWGTGAGNRNRNGSAV